ncbi:hypothetical protein GI374_08675 [Paracoccus sp. S-4012]|uniref:hypothetical protein n=1 Tax=Paracoccus sp. S-4012 TaxID=2665648 RepID=UPI0012B08AA2|nr:hypothetical protein [Paracoccus sp. S-4012]MRX50514.1 hypothetical protein [Paracoccus sp. S-4012]
MADAPTATVAKWRRLTDLLLKLTEIGKISWEKTAQEGKYLTSMGSETIVLQEMEAVDERGNPHPFFKISIHNFIDEEVDSFTDDDIGGMPYFSRIRDMIRVIERKATGAEETLDELISRLDELDPDRIPF